MLGVAVGFTTIGAVVAAGVLVAHLGVLGPEAQRVLNQVAYYIGSPALLLTTVARADVGDILSRSLLATAAGVAVAALVYLVVASRWRQSAGERAIGALSSSFVNSGNLGIPIAAYVLGDAAFVAPTLLLQNLVVQPLALSVLDAEHRGRRPSVLQVLWRPLTNPLTIGALSGLVLSVTGWSLPQVVLAPIELVASLAVPTMLIAYGVALRHGPGFGGSVRRAELATTTVVKMVVQPLVAWAVGAALGLEGIVLVAVVVVGALPTAQAVFVFASRYERSPTLARDTILLTTGASVPAVALVVGLLG